MTGKKRILPEVASSSKEFDRKNGSFNDTKEDIDEISMPKTSPVKDLKIKKKVKKQKLDPDEIFNGEASDMDSNPQKHEKSPKEMHQICKAILEKCSQKSFTLSNRKASCSFESLLKEFSIDVGMSAKELQTIFRNYYKSASLLKNTPLEDALKRVMHYTQNANCMTGHPDFPKHPQAAYNIFCRRVNCNFAILPKKLQEQFRDETDPLAIECKEEAKQDRLRFIEQLKDFLAQHSDSLFDSQINQIRNKIKRMEAIKGEKADNSLPNVEKKKKLTAFDFYKSTKKHKYTHLDEEERDAKLLRHYEKLADNIQKVYEELAANQ